jgi:hypothetical protein
MRHAFLLACLLSLVSATANASQSSGADAGKVTIQPQQPKGATPTFIAPPPLLVAPTCPTCWIWRGLSGPGAVTAPSAPLLVAPRGCGGGGCSTLSPDLMAPSEPLLVAPRACGGSCITLTPGLMAPSAPLLVAPRGCGGSCQDPSDVEYAWKYRTPLRLAGGPPTSVVDTCHARQCAG